MQIKNCLISLGIILLGVLLVIENRTQTVENQIETVNYLPVSTNSKVCKLTKVEPYFDIEYVFITDSCGSFYISNEKFDQLERTDFFKSIRKSDSLTFYYNYQDSSSGKYIQEIKLNNRIYLQRKTISTHKEIVVVKAKGLKLIGPYLIIFLGLFYFLITRALQKSRFSSLERSTSLKAKNTWNLQNGLYKMPIGFQIKEVNQKYLIDYLGEGNVFKEVGTITRDTVEFKRQKIDIQNIEYLGLFMSSETRPSRMEAEFYIKLKRGKFKLLFAYQKEFSEFDSDYRNFWERQNLKILQKLSEISDIPYRFKSEY